MTMPAVSVIVPCYNAEAYLAPCVESILAQTEQSWELLLVNDGSTDGTPALCRALAEKDGRIRVIEQENAGVSAARNAGLDAARGEYVAFLDSDDAYTPGAFAALLAAARREDADIVEGGVRCENETGEELWTYLPGTETLRAPDETIARHIPAPHGLYNCWRLLYRRAFLGSTRFAALTRGEDALFVTELFTRCRVYASVGEIVYRYVVRSGSVMRQSFRPATLDFVRSWAKIYELLKEKVPELAPRAAGIVLWQCDRVFRCGMESGDAHWRECRAELIGARRRFAPLCAGASLKKAAGRVLFAVSPELYYRRGGKGKR